MTNLKNVEIEEITMDIEMLQYYKAAVKTVNKRGLSVNSIKVVNVEEDRFTLKISPTNAGAFYDIFFNMGFLYAASKSKEITKSLEEDFKT